MKGRYLKLATIETLVISIPSNLKDYTQKDHNFSDLESNTFSFESEKIDVDAGSWAHLRPFESGSNVEAYNSCWCTGQLRGYQDFRRMTRVLDISITHYWPRISSATVRKVRKLQIG